MRKSTLLQKLQTSISADERDKLVAGSDLIISNYNRLTALELLTHENLVDGEIDGIKVGELTNVLDSYLKEYLADKPSAWKWIIICCIYLTFICEKPMHAQQSAHYTIQEIDGKRIYHCPIREDGPGSVCRFCICED